MTDDIHPGLEAARRHAQARKLLPLASRSDVLPADPWPDAPPEYFDPREPNGDGAASSGAGDDRRKIRTLTGSLLNREQVRELPKPEPLIDNVLDRGTVALLYGRWGTLKSFIALDWLASVATGRPWQRRPTERLRALYVAAEGAFGLAARLDAWEIAETDDSGR